MAIRLPTGASSRIAADVSPATTTFVRISNPLTPKSLSDLRTEFREAFAEQGLLHLRIGCWPIRLLFDPLTRLAARNEAMAGDLLDLGAVDDQLTLGDTHWQSLADVPPRD